VRRPRVLLASATNGNWALGFRLSSESVDSPSGSLHLAAGSYGRRSPGTRITISADFGKWTGSAGLRSSGDRFHYLRRRPITPVFARLLYESAVIPRVRQRSNDTTYSKVAGYTRNVPLARKEQADDIGDANGRSLPPNRRHLRHQRALRAARSMRFSGGAQG
jgi:hypothetical protein